MLLAAELHPPSLTVLSILASFFYVLLPWLQAWSVGPAQLAKLNKTKGRLAPGLDADIVVWSPDQAADTSLDALQHLHKVSPYIGMSMQGRVLATFVDGHQVFGEQQGVASEACGSPILKKRWW